MNIYKYLLILSVFTLTGTNQIEAQERPLTLNEAIAEAQSRHPEVLIAEAQAEAAREGARASGAFRYPGVALEAGWMRSNDPVAAFGTRLRQTRFSTEDFDPARLNAPAPLSDWTSGFVVGWTPLDLSALAGFRAASQEAEAAGHGAIWARRAAGFRAQIRYIETVGALRQLDAAELALESTQENARRIEARVQEGLLTDADLLQARAAEEGARANRVMARQRLGDTQARLALALGWEEAVVPVPTETSFAFALGEQGDLALRPDIQANQQEVDAAATRVSQAHRARLPIVEAFGQVRTHAPEVTSGLENNWSMGVQIRVPVFTGYGLTSRQRAAEALHEAAKETTRLYIQEAVREIQQTERALETTRAAATAALAASLAAEEAVRLLQRRFDEGMVTTGELLTAQAQAAAFQAQAIDAELAYQQTVAHLAFLTHPLDEGMDR